ncbi:hypothetical protein OHR68_40420 [Spirillospora sp. NBC_00431]
MITMLFRVGSCVAIANATRVTEPKGEFDENSDSGEAVDDLYDEVHAPTMTCSLFRSHLGGPVAAFSSLRDI